MLSGLPKLKDETSSISNKNTIVPSIPVGVYGSQKLNCKISTRTKAFW